MAATSNFNFKVPQKGGPANLGHEEVLPKLWWEDIRQGQFIANESVGFVMYLLQSK